jgi:hypothetical protein
LAGAIDGMLLWIEWPSEAECDIACCSSVKFFCRRKHKFGLNLQSTCDLKCRFLDLNIAHPASTSDYLSFSMSNFKSKLEKPGFFTLHLWDSAYVNYSYMATPYKNFPLGSKDDYNHYHSQLYI